MIPTMSVSSVAIGALKLPKGGQTGIARAPGTTCWSSSDGSINAVPVSLFVSLALFMGGRGCKFPGLNGDLDGGKNWECSETATELCAHDCCLCLPFDGDWDW